MEFRAFLVLRAQELSKVAPFPVALEICRKGVAQRAQARERQKKRRNQRRLHPGSTQKRCRLAGGRSVDNAPCPQREQNAKLGVCHAEDQQRQKRGDPRPDAG